MLCMAASEPDRKLFTGSSDSKAQSWNVETEQAHRVLRTSSDQAPVTYNNYACRLTDRQGQPCLCLSTLACACN